MDEKERMRLAAASAMDEVRRHGVIPEKTKWQIFKEAFREALTEDVPRQLSGAVASINDAASFGAIPAIQESLPPWMGGVLEGTYSNAMAAAPFAAMAAGFAAPNPLGKVGQVAKTAVKSVRNAGRIARGEAIAARAADETGKTWYHGTSTNAGLDIGDEMDPRHGGFTNAVWATSDYKTAKQFARDASVIDGGDPVVYRLNVPLGAKIEKSTAENTIDSGRMNAAPRFQTDADAILTEEFGEPTLAITKRGPITVGGVETDDSINEYLRRRDAERVAKK